MKLWLLMVIIVSMSFTHLNITKTNVNMGNSTMDAFRWLKATIEGVMDNGFKLMQYLLIKAFYMLLTLARILYMVVGLAGFVSWFTGYSPYRGRRMVIGALLLALVTEGITRFGVHP